MYRVDAPPVAYAAPWDRSFDDRFAELKRGSIRVAYYYDSPESGTFRYRAYNMVQAINARGGALSAAHFSFGDAFWLDSVVDACDILVVCRAPYYSNLNLHIARARACGKRVFFDIDDLIFDVDYVHLFLETVGENPWNLVALNHWFAYAGRLGAALRLCDAVLTTNDHLAGHAARYGGIPARVLPNFLNREQTELSCRIFAAKRQAGFPRTGRITLAYFSGSRTHNRDFAGIADGLAEMLAADTGLELLLGGHLQPPAALAGFGARVRSEGFRDFLNLQLLIAGAEINLVPLQFNSFTNAKSELKYFEAAIVGSTTVATPTFSFRQAITDGVTGYLASDHEWPDRIARARADIDGSSGMLERAHHHALATYGWQAQYDRIESALLGELTA